MEAYKKKLLILRSQLVGAGYSNALIALEKGLKYHKGKRKGGDPEFSHQVDIALFALTLPGIRDMERLITVILLHDVREDYDIANEELISWFPDRMFAMNVAASVENMTKIFRKVRKDDSQVFAALAEDEYGSLAKLCDRIHNLQSMAGVFTLVRQREYIKEVDDFFFPMLKAAKRNFPWHTSAYENIKWMINSQVNLLRHIHMALEPATEV
jgi:(p)ppGpp synthase/HD superfamily hydrolase